MLFFTELFFVLFLMRCDVQEVRTVKQFNSRELRERSR
jgi:hypothetical protein